MVVRTDSAGIEIMQITNLDTTAIETWTIGPQPSTIIGDETRGESHILQRTLGQVRLSDGRVVIATDQNEIREFDSTGTFIKTIARRGHGPGEFSELTALQRINNDTILVYERFPASITIVSPEGKYIRRSQVARPKTNDAFGAFQFTAAFPDGSLLVNRHPGEYHLPIGATHVDSVNPLRVDASGTVIADFHKRWDVTRMRILPIGISNNLPANEHVSIPHPIQQAAWGRVGNLVYYTTRSRFEIELWSNNGKLIRIVRMPTEYLAKSSFDSLIATRVSRNDTTRYDIGKFMPDSMPPISAMSGDLEGNMWVMLEKGAIKGSARAALVLDSTGAPLAIAHMPPSGTAAVGSWRLIAGFSPQVFDRNTLTTAAMDADDRWHVLVFHIHKAPALHATKPRTP